MPVPRDIIDLPPPGYILALANRIMLRMQSEFERESARLSTPADRAQIFLLCAAGMIARVGNAALSEQPDEIKRSPDVRRRMEIIALDRLRTMIFAAHAAGT